MDDDTKTLFVTIDAGAHRTTKCASNGARDVQPSRNDGNRPKLPIDTLSRLLSERNIDLLRMIKSARPESVSELARLSGRPKASLTLTLRRLEQFGIVVFKATSGRRKIPTVTFDKLMLEVAIDP